MALVIEPDGKETIGGVIAIRNAFVEASGKQLACTHATMTHGEGNSQILEFAGVYCADGAPFRVKHEVPAGTPLGAAASAMAKTLIEGSLIEGVV